jgi:autotransporter-associated beta strand protein
MKSTLPRPSSGESSPPRHRWPLYLAASVLAVLPARADIASGLVFHLPLDEGNGIIASDATGSGNGGKLEYFSNPSESWSSGRIGGGLRFASSDTLNNAVIVVEPGQFPDFAADPVFTISFWTRGDLAQKAEGAGVLCIGIGGGSEMICIDVYQNRFRFFVRAQNGAASGVHSLVGPNLTWQHLAVTFNANDRTMKMYVNGTEVGSAVAPTALLASPDPLDIGARYFQGGYTLNYRGILDDVRIYDRALTESDIQELVADAGALPLEFVEQPSDLEITIDGEIHLEALADASVPISYQWQKDGEDLPGATQRLLMIPGATLDAAGDYSVRISAEGNAPLTSTPATVTVLPADLERGLVFHFNFDETTGTSATDASGNGNNAELLRFAGDDSQWVPGVVGGGIRLNGPGTGDNQLVITESPVSLENQDHFSFSFWAKPDPYGSVFNPRIVGPADATHWVLWKPNFGMGIWDNVPSSFVPAIGEWAHYAVTYDRSASAYSVYANGELLVSNVPAIRATPGTAQWMVGHHENRNMGFEAQGGGDNFRGTLDEVRMYNRLLAPTEVKMLYAQAAAVPGWQTWTNGEDNLNWDQISQNWSEGGTWSSRNAIFGGTGNGNIAISPSGITANRIIIDQPGYTFSGGPLTLSTIGDSTLYTRQDATLTADVRLTGTQSWRVAAGKTLTVGNIGSEITADFGMRGPGTFVINGSIGSNIGSVLFNSNHPTKAVFTQPNSFSGLLFLGNGGGANTLEFSAVNQLGSGVGGNYLAIQNGSTLRYTGTGSEATANRDVFWNVGAATIDIVQPTAELILNISGGTRNQAFTKAGPGKLTLVTEGATGAMTLAGGTLKLRDVLTGHSAPTNITANGKLELTNSRMASVLTGAGTLEITGGALSRSTGGRIELTGQIRISENSQFGNDNLAVNWANNRASMHIDAGSTLDLRGDAVVVDALTGSGTVNNSYYRSTAETLTVGVAGGSGVFNGTITGDVTTAAASNGRISVIKTGTGTQTFTGPNSYSGNTTILNGVLSLARTDLSDTGTLTITGDGRLHLTHTGIDRVGALVLGTETMPDGVYGPVGSTAPFTTEFITGTGFIRVGEPPLSNGYAAWAASIGIDGEPPENDFDGDGLSNLLEFALAGTDPRQSDPSPGDVIDGMLVFQKRPEAVASGEVSYHIETSTDAGVSVPWTVVAAAVQTETSISIAIPPRAPRIFARLRVDRAP